MSAEPLRKAPRGPIIFLLARSRGARCRASLSMCSIGANRRNCPFSQLQRGRDTRASFLASAAAGGRCGVHPRDSDASRRSRRRIPSALSGEVDFSKHASGNTRCLVRLDIRRAGGKADGSRRTILPLLVQPRFSGHRKAGFHAFHAAEIPFLFGTTTLTPPHWPAVPQTAAQMRLSNAMQGYWASFARDGIPRAQVEQEWRPTKRRRGLCHPHREPDPPQPECPLWLKSSSWQAQCGTAEIRRKPVIPAHGPHAQTDAALNQWARTALFADRVQRVDRRPNSDDCCPNCA